MISSKQGSSSRLAWGGLAKPAGPQQRTAGAKLLIHHPSPSQSGHHHQHHLHITSHHALRLSAVAVKWDSVAYTVLIINKLTPSSIYTHSLAKN
ncbi:hypothetical protein PGT21_005164 [Puccinia graminis f. sp. tritici]|uniref:Uncharacterized protein n=1 Tax=Puccinia graminis f. sp. tritici TaxID=56615 RepID=A0A5B0RDN7_PUCGR|nr:hypothetical protein PGT21_005164 [Puccinia graminis f. sp. tritici]KAA1123163.1 hypothetical protein PGTUg99_018005 [Puccinia graminis f. sp. tritici]